LCKYAESHGPATHGKLCTSCHRYAEDRNKRLTAARHVARPARVDAARERLKQRQPLTPTIAPAATPTTIAISTHNWRGDPVVSLARVVAIARARATKADPFLTYKRECEYGTSEHSERRRYDLAVMVQTDKLLADLGVTCEVGLATATSGNPAAPVVNRRQALRIERKPPRSKRPGVDTQRPFVEPTRIPNGHVVVRVPVRSSPTAPPLDTYEAAEVLGIDDAKHIGIAYRGTESVHLFAVRKANAA
jgi:hypothetical protein